MSVRSYLCIVSRHRKGKYSMQTIIKLVGIVLVEMVIIFTTVIIVNGINKQSDDPYAKVKQYAKNDSVAESTLEAYQKGCVGNEEAAKQIAAAIFDSLTGENGYDKDLPLIAEYDEKKEVWTVRSQIPEGADGGGLNIIIRKSNGEILAFWGEM